MRKDIIVTYPDESLRQVADLMALHDVGVLPVVERAMPHKLCGLITQYNLLTAHERMLLEERKREQVLHLSFPTHFGNRFRGMAQPVKTDQPASMDDSRPPLEQNNVQRPVDVSKENPKKDDTGKPPLSE
jgi:CBS-domain-containing membrane protein